MAKQKNTRAGGKFTGSHGTMTELAARVADIASDCSCVRKIAIGLIQTSRGRGGASRRVKILVMPWCLRLTVTANAAVQTLFVYGDSLSAMVQKLKEKLEAAGLAVFVQKEDVS